MEATNLMPVLTLPVPDGRFVNVPLDMLREVSTFRCRTTLVTKDDQVISLACTAAQAKIMWVAIIINLAQMGVNFSQRDYGVLPLLSETEEKVMLTTALESNLTYHEYAHGVDLQQWANEDRLRFLEILKERKSDVQIM